MEIGYLIHLENRINNHQIDLKVGGSYRVIASRPSPIYYFKYTKKKPKHFGFNHYYVYPHFNLDKDKEFESDFVKAKLFKVKNIGTNHIVKLDTIYTNAISVLEEVDISDSIKYDKKGNVIFIKEYDQYDHTWYRFYFQYDNSNRMIEAKHQSMSNKKYYTEFHDKYIYDKNNLIEIQEFDGKKFIMSESGSYDKNNRLIEYRNKDGGYFKKIFDNDGKLVYIQDNGYEISEINN